MIAPKVATPFPLVGLALPALKELCKKLKLVLADNASKDDCIKLISQAVAKPPVAPVAVVNTVPVKLAPVDSGRDGKDIVRDCKDEATVTPPDHILRALARILHCEISAFTGVQWKWSHRTLLVSPTLWFGLFAAKPIGRELLTEAETNLPGLLMRELRVFFETRFPDARRSCIEDLLADWRSAYDSWLAEVATTPVLSSEQAMVTFLERIESRLAHWTDHLNTLIDQENVAKYGSKATSGVQRLRLAKANDLPFGEAALMEKALKSSTKDSGFTGGSSRRKRSRSRSRSPRRDGGRRDLKPPQGYPHGTCRNCGIKPPAGQLPRAWFKKHHETCKVKI